MLLWGWLATAAAAYTCACRLLDVVVTGKQRKWPEELVQRRLLDELEEIPQVSLVMSAVLLQTLAALSPAPAQAASNVMGAMCLCSLLQQLLVWQSCKLQLLISVAHVNRQRYSPVPAALPALYCVFQINLTKALLCACCVCFAQVSGLENGELLSEFRRCRCWHCTNGPAGSGPAAFAHVDDAGDQQKKVKQIDAELEELLLQQVGACDFVKDSVLARRSMFLLNVQQPIGISCAMFLHSEVVHHASSSMGVEVLGAACCISCIAVIFCWLAVSDKSVLLCVRLQVMAALAATVGSSTTEPLQPDSAATPPPDFLCPISKQLMTDAVILVETGHSFEAANIQRWLDMNDKCPMTGQKLQSKQLISNYTLKGVIADWATSHGITLPSAPVYTPISTRSASAAEATAGSGFSGAFPAPSAPPMAPGAAAHTTTSSSSCTEKHHTVLTLPGITDASGDPPPASQPQDTSADQPDQNKDSQHATAVSYIGSKDHSFFPPWGRKMGAAGHGSGSSSSSSGKQGAACGVFGRCTRTKWAITLIVLVVLLTIGVGVGVGAGIKRMKSKPTTSPNAVEVS